MPIGVLLDKELTAGVSDGLPRFVWWTVGVVGLAWLSFLTAATEHRGRVIGTECRYPDGVTEVCEPLRGRDEVELLGGQAAFLVGLDLLLILDHRRRYPLSK